MAHQDSWKVTTDHRLIAENLQSSLKQRDFTIIESIRNTHVPTARRKASRNGKIEQIAHLKGRNGSVAIQEMLTGYRSTSHPATGVAPYEALVNRQVRTKLDHQTREISENDCDTAIRGKRDTKNLSNRMLKTGTPRNTTSF